MKRYLLPAILLPFLLTPLAPAQNNGAPDLRRLARDAGLIFSGMVQSSEHVLPAASGDIGVVRITFRVSEAQRGATAGETLTISEWDGLWTSRDRYRVGELLLFLYAPSGDLGLTTTVGGEQGRISLAGSQLTLESVARQLADTGSAFDEKPRPTRPPQRRAGSVAVE